MRINVKEIIGGRHLTEQRAELDISDILADNPSAKATSPLQATVDAAGDGEFALVSGQLACGLELVCSRCLKSFPHAFAVEFEERFVPGQGPEEEPDPDDDRMIHVVETDVIELDPYLIENALVAIPAFPLCEEDCRGLCPECGTNRNEQDCDCRQERIDPRLLGLKDWFKQ